VAVARPHRRLVGRHRHYQRGWQPERQRHWRRGWRPERQRHWQQCLVGALPPVAVAVARPRRRLVGDAWAGRL